MHSHTLLLKLGCGSDHSPRQGTEVFVALLSYFRDQRKWTRELTYALTFHKCIAIVPQLLCRCDFTAVSRKPTRNQTFFEPKRDMKLEGSPGRSPSIHRLHSNGNLRLTWITVAGNGYQIRQVADHDVRVSKLGHRLLRPSTAVAFGACQPR
ncbi:hypothetical protein BC835DRAFT_663316 [Cytidiella melzeri]|nr:hypothetical protein BC835DRAFT_663316 [Cytidiella melzeri]